MVALRAVKDTFVLPLIFLRNLTVLFVLFLAGYTVVAWGTGVAPEDTTVLSFLPGFLLSGIRAVFPFSVVLSLVFSLFRIKRRPGLAPLSVVVLLVTASVVFVLEPFMLSEYGAPLERNGKRVFTVDEGYIGTYGGSGVYVGRQEGPALANVLRVERGNDPLLHFLPAAEAGGSALSPAAEWDRAGPNDLPPFAEVFSAPPFVAAVFNDVSAMNGVLEELYRSSFPMLVLTALTSLFSILMGGLFLSRSRWPLFNGVMILLLLRGFLLVFPVLWGRGVLQIAGLFVKEKYLSFVPAGLFFVTGIFFLLSILLSFLSGRNRNGRTYG